MPFLGVSLDEISRGVVTKPGAQECRWERSGWRDCRNRILKRGETPDRVLEERTVGREYVQCEEALYDRDARTWSCFRTGAPCGYATHPGCHAPAALSTWVEDLVLGVERLPVTPDGLVIYPVASGRPEEDAEAPSSGAPGAGGAGGTGAGTALALGALLVAVWWVMR